MAISIAHPERYDGFVWGESPDTPPVKDEPSPVPEQYEMVGFDQPGDYDAPFLWGRLKPQYR